MRLDPPLPDGAVPGDDHPVGHGGRHPEGDGRRVPDVDVDHLAAPLAAVGVAQGAEDHPADELVDAVDGAGLVPDEPQAEGRGRVAASDREAVHEGPVDEQAVLPPHRGKEQGQGHACHDPVLEAGVRRRGRPKVDGHPGSEVGGHHHEAATRRGGETGKGQVRRQAAGGEAIAQEAPQLPGCRRAPSGRQAGAPTR